MTAVRALELTPEGLRLLDQRRLPAEDVYITCKTAAEVGECIRTLAVRGAPAIGIAAAYGVYLAARALADPAGGAGEGGAARDPDAFLERLAGEAEALRRVRPTAVNLAWAVDRMMAVARRSGGRAPAAVAAALREEALAVHREDVAMNRRIGRFGARLVRDGDDLLTHCNTGALATGGYGTALGVVRAAAEEGKRVHVYVDETRPLLQGARLTAWELRREGVPATLITDSMAAHVMRRRGVDLVLVGADRICANGDVANKIGTYGLAVLAREHGVPFYVAAPWSTVDLSLATGDEVVIEEREAAEVVGFAGVRWAPEGIAVANPAFDVTPARYITGIITDRGIAHPPFDAALRELACRPAPAAAGGGGAGEAGAADAEEANARA